METLNANLYNLHWDNKISSDIINNLENYEIKFEINNEESKIVEIWIKEENLEHWKHMLEKDYKEILEEANKFGCCLIKVDWKLIWFVKIMPAQINWKTLFEWGSLFVDKEYRKKWLWKILVKEIIQKYSNLPLYSVTNIPAVMNISWDLWQYKYLKSDLSNDILEIIESEWKLLENDVIHWNEIFNILIKQYDKISYNI